MKHEFRTIIKPPHYDFSVSFDDTFFLTGSCFSEEIGNRLYRHGFTIKENPSGILFNPLSIELSFSQILESSYSPTEAAFITQNGIWLSLMHHSSVSHKNRESLYRIIEEGQLEAKEFLKNCSIIIITLGSAHYYYHNAKKLIVANCHKLPAETFTRKTMTHSEIAVSISKIIQMIQKVNNTARIIFTVSPVIHQRNGLIENMRSKATLISALHESLSKKDNAYYFPSFEILTQDLRDYRFYKEDMIHPTKIAVDYIWNIFKSSFFSKETEDLAGKCAKLYARFEHKAFIPESEGHARFLQKTDEQLKLLRKHLGKDLFIKEEKAEEN
ncbi:MAG: GSCFA domain-containing protein [Spirochaetes bacterium]|jgi:hypothetical protein|nr:GSCFA domain-containing protein [Spirochaetota bacterium]